MSESIITPDTLKNEHLRKIIIQARREISDNRLWLRLFEYIIDLDKEWQYLNNIGNSDKGEKE